MTIESAPCLMDNYQGKNGAYSYATLQPIKGLRDTVVNPLTLNLAKAQPWKHDFLYPLICEQAVSGLLCKYKD
jgi:hypothetical protein